MYIINTIKKLKKSKRIFFTTPGHALGKIIPTEMKNFIGKKVFNTDFSEVEGLDILSKPNGCILKSQQKASKIYGTKSTFYLVNGSTSGILALMLASLQENDKVLVARNCHICVYNGLILTGARPVWFMGEFDESFGLFKGITLEDVKQAYEKDVKAIIITGPTYAGVCSEIKEIAEFCKKKNIIFIVDEAHGAFLPFSDKLPKSAIELGADGCVQSLHKNTPALNGSALLHLSKNSKISAEKIQEALNIINTTSPSFLLLSSIEADISYLNSKKGRKSIDNLIKNIEEFKKSCKNAEFYDDGNNDITKLVFKIKGVTGEKLAEALNQNNIEEEFCTEKSAICITNLSTSKKELNKLKKVIEDIKPNEENKTEINKFVIPKQIFTPKEMQHKEFEYIKKEKAENRISAELIIPYPPGIPLLVSGELITKTHIKQIEADNIKVLKREEI
jgi:arginine/lysine/ornithine decarboxylase